MFGLNTAHSLQAVVERIRQVTQPDVFLMTGDLSQDETPESYRQLQRLIAPFQVPAYWIPGNHDDSAIIESVLTTAPISADKFFQMGNWRFILLSSQRPGKVYGELSADTLDQLTQQLQHYPQYPTLIALHHPPCAIGSAWMDQIGLKNPEDFFAVIDRFPQVKLVIFGHIHQAFSTKRNGVNYWGCPATCMQFLPNATEFTLDQRATPGFRILTLHANGDYEIQVERTDYPLPTYPDPKPIRAMLGQLVSSGGG